MKRGRSSIVACPLREGILCDRFADCDGCGWNPKVEKERIRDLREKYNAGRKPPFIRRSFVPGESSYVYVGRRSRF